MSTLVTAQYEITIDAYVKDRATQQPIPFVNIGFLDKGIGTVSDQDGHVFLQYDEEAIGKNDIVQLSSLGYETIQLSVDQLFELLTKSNTIFMESTIYELEAATIVAAKRKEKTVGNSYKYTGIIGYWKDKQALGGEIATRIKIRNKNSKLLQLKFNIHENNTDSLLVRVNVYESNKKKPGRNLLTSNVYHTITRKKGEEIIDLSGYNIVVSDDIIVSLELIKVYGEQVEFSISASKEGRSYLRYISQDQWKGFNDVGMAFSLDISYPAGKTEVKKREKPANILLYWDTSLSAGKNDPTTTLEFLKRYLKKIRKTTVTLVTFSDIIHEPQKFTIEKGKSDQLMQSLSNLSYNGATNFAPLFKQKDAPDQYIVVSDGYVTYGIPTPVYDIPVFYINHTSNANDRLLQKLAVDSEGYYLNLAKIPVEEAIPKILNEVEDNNVYQTDKTRELVSGTVYSNGEPIQGCKVSVKGSLIETVTSPEGSFTINAGNEDVLKFEFFGMITQEVTLDAIKNLTIDLVSKYTVLEEVLLDAKENKAPEEKVDIGGRKVNKNAVGYATYTLEEEDFPKSAIYLADLIRSRFPGVQVSGFGDNATYRIRGNSSFNNDRQPLFVVDGAQYQTTPIFLQPSQIKRISVISSVTGAVRYGEAGRGGIFVITTKSSERGYDKDGKPINDLLVKGNDYTKSSFLMDVNDNRPEYLEPLWNSTTYAGAKEVYDRLRKEYPLSIPFYSYSASYFTRWDTVFANQILSNIAEIGFDNPQALRVLAFKLEALGRNDTATLLYERIFDLAPNAAQSYLDLARIYVEIKKYQPAFELYKKILQNEQTTTDFKEIAEQAESEIQRLLNLHRSEISYEDVPEKFLEVKGIPVRIVFEWSDPQSEFELQFVNPKNKFYVWQHVFQVNKEEMLSQVESGVMSKEFIIDRAMPGQWIINVQSFGDNVSALNPEFMKYTIYTNYGLENETKKVQCINLYNQKEKVTLDKIIL
ncbi:carboxypeptidase-like regulatory domain-containing protein [uncultured Aquimarina sp.]|uniref:carboxypeptidase-like regulatory domain-containing protein n=1 Tax=uncultured Aquimarina sp. TaxID=575652 RepID=UPI0026374B9C|nr:carboxypeptidase-like regulatory domain-containing protein [uncultured Aquimarina sp.]